MLKKAVVCIMLAAAAAMAWQQLQDVPDVQVEPGAHLTWGNGRVWGLFPVSGGGAGPAYVRAYDPSLDCEDSLPDSLMWDTTITVMAGTRLHYTSFTFQWGEREVPFGIGEHEDLCRLYWLPQNTNTWLNDTIDTFALGDGASIAFAPNGSYDIWEDANPGWIYCYPGGDDTTFWRYALPATLLPDLGLYAYYPGPNAIIADQTPPFKWSPCGQPTQYRIKVSTDSTFSGAPPIIDTVLSVPEYEPPTKLENDTYYWRSAYRTGMTWSWSCTHSFELLGGWERRCTFPQEGHDGTIIAYDAGSFFDGSTSILALINGSSDDYFYRYDVQMDAWYEGDAVPSPWHVDDGTSLTTAAPYGGVPHIKAAFYGEGTDDVPYSYHPESTAGHRWQPFDIDQGTPYWNSHFPGTLGYASSMVMGPNYNMYLCPGNGGEGFYRVEPPDGSRGGGQGDNSQVRGPKAHVVAGHDGVEIVYDLPSLSRVRATLHDALGRQVGVLDAGHQKPGTHHLKWSRYREGRRLAAGAYFVLLDIGSQRAGLKAVVR
jgi:hypothetical protein